VKFTVFRHRSFSWLFGYLSRIRVRSARINYLFIAQYLLFLAVTIIACGQGINLDPIEASSLFTETYLNEQVTRTITNTLSSPEETKPPLTEKTETYNVGTTPSPSKNDSPPMIQTTVLETATLTLPEILPGVPIHILSPGERSRVVSPIEMMIFLDVVPKNPIIIELYGSMGQLLVRHVRLVDLERDKFYYTLFLPYEISTDLESGRLSIILRDEYGRYEHVHSVDLFLVNYGYAQLNAANVNPVITINQPASKDIIEGGFLAVRGEVCLEITDSLRVILVDQNGKVVGQRLAAVDSTAPSGCLTFTSEVPYIVEEETSVRLIVYKEGSPLSEYDQLSSLLIVLKP